MIWSKAPSKPDLEVVIGTVLRLTHVESSEVESYLPVEGRSDGPLAGPGWGVPTGVTGGLDHPHLRVVVPATCWTNERVSYGK